VLSCSWHTILLSALIFFLGAEEPNQVDGLKRLLRDCAGLRELNINGDVSLQHGTLVSLGTLAQLRGFTGFQACTWLRRLSVHSSWPATLRHLCTIKLGRCPTLRELEISGCPLSKDTGAMLQKLLNSLRLEKLTVHGWIEWSQVSTPSRLLAPPIPTMPNSPLECHSA
jgi:hypothetical protein